MTDIPAAAKYNNKLSKKVNKLTDKKSENISNWILGFVTLKLNNVKITYSVRLVAVIPETVGELKDYETSELLNTFTLCYFSVCSIRMCARA